MHDHGYMYRNLYYNWIGRVGSVGSGFLGVNYWILNENQPDVQGKIINGH